MKSTAKVLISTCDPASQWGNQMLTSQDDRQRPEGKLCRSFISGLPPTIAEAGTRYPLGWYSLLPRR